MMKRMKMRIMMKTLKMIMMMRRTSARIRKENISHKGKGKVTEELMR